MKTITFYATPHEMFDWVEEWRRTFKLHVGFISFQPRFQLFPLGDEERIDTVCHPYAAEGRRYDEIWLNLEPFATTGQNSTEIRKENRNRLEISFPRMTKSTVEQIDMGTTTEERGPLRVWKNIFADLKRRTNAGMWVVGGTGAKAFYKDKLYSPGIAEAAKQGMRLNNLTGLPVTIVEPK